MAEEKKEDKPKDEKKDSPKPKEVLTMVQLRDIFMNNTKHTNGELSKDEEVLINRMIALINTKEGNTRSGRNALEEVQRWIPVGHPMDTKAAEALMAANNTKEGWF